MKKEYKEASLSSVILGDDCTIYEVIEDNHSIILRAKMHRLEYACPHCGTSTSKVCSTYTRTLQHVPFKPGKSTTVEVLAYKYRCPQCNHVFNQPLSFARPWQVRTDVLNELILLFSLFNSYEGCARLLREHGIRICADTIQKMTERIEFESYDDVTEIAVDDIAIHKGQTYVTMIYESRKKELITVLDGRSDLPLRQWLEQHPKVTMIERDRYGPYTNAISAALPDTVQIADRFHLYQNLFEHFKKHFYQAVPEAFYLQEGKILLKPVYDYIVPDPDPQLLDSLHYDLSPPVDPDGQILEFDTGYWSRLSPTDIRRREKMEKQRQEKRKRIQDVRNFCSSEIERGRKHSQVIREASVKFSLSVPSVNKYLSLSEEQLEELLRPKQKKKARRYVKYAGLIYKMFRDGYSTLVIEQYIQRKYAEDGPSLKKYIFGVCSNNFPGHKVHSPWYNHKAVLAAGVVKVKRIDLLKQLLVKDEKKKNTVIQENMEAIIEAYPVCQEIVTIYREFDSIIFGRDPDKLDEFISHYEEKSPIEGFCKGLKKEAQAVKNAITHSQNSGAAEGLNNRAKVLKRTVYGRIRLRNFEIRLKMVLHSNKYKEFLPWLRTHFKQGKKLF